MRLWFIENFGNCLVIGILAVLCFLAIHYIYKTKKEGKCIGCSESTCSNCMNGRNIVAEARKAYNEDQKKSQSST